MKKTTLEFDEQLFHDVREALGTRGLKETVQKAFREVLVLRARRELIPSTQGDGRTGPG